MKSLALAVALSAMLVAGPSYAQQAAAPAAPAPAQAAAAAPAIPFPAGATIAYLNIQRIANESAEGKSATTRVKALNDKKVAELAGKQKQLTDAQEKLQKGGAMMNDAARGGLEKEIEKLQVDIQRYTQDAQAEVQELQQELQNEFQRKLMPIIDAVAKEKNLQMVFSVADAGVVWAYPGLDVTGDVIKRFDQVVASPAAPKQ
ncbi:MAG: OmpH family outer membrane protein [Acidobacteria bacterium]|nr:OmpH family outer membrane protein [Acidobacteriota bacterium]